MSKSSIFTHKQCKLAAKAMTAEQVLFLLLCCLYFVCIECKVWNILNEGAIASNSSISACNINTQIITQLLKNQLQSGDTLLIPDAHQFWLNGGIYIDSIANIIIQIDGSIHYQNNRKYWPTKNDSDHVLEAMQFTNVNNITFTSSHQSTKGLINGHGSSWWGSLNYCIYKENRFVHTFMIFYIPCFDSFQYIDLDYYIL